MTSKRPTKKEAKAAYDEYVDSVPARLDAWKREVASTGGPRLEELDGTRDSLDGVVKWLEAQHADGRSVAELAPGWAVYLAACLQRNVPGAQWTFWEGNDVCRYKPVLSGFTIPCNVRQISVTSLSKLLTTDPPVDPRRDPEALHRIFDVYVDSVMVDRRPMSDEPGPPEVIELDGDLRWDLLVQFDDGTPEFVVEALVAELRSDSSIEEVVHEDRETVYVRLASRGDEHARSRIEQTAARHL